MVDIKNHFQEFYEKIIYLDNNVGYNEKTFSKGSYIYCDTYEKKTFYGSLYEETSDDKRVYLRISGIKMILTYGEWYNKKYGNIELNIFKDENYNDKIVSISDAILFLNEYISNNYKEYSKKINREIYKASGEKIIVKYKHENILNFDNLKRITIIGLTITNQDINSLLRYKKLVTLETINCKIDADLSLLKVRFYLDNNSIFNNISQFNNSKIESLLLNSSTFTNQNISNINMTTNSLQFRNININYEMFFLMSNICGLKSLTIEDYELNPLEIELLRVFYELNELTCNGSCYSLSFLNNLNELESFQGYIKLISDKYYDYLKHLYKEKFEEYKKKYNNEYIKNILCNIKLHNKKIIPDLIIDKVALIKWEGKIENATLEEIRTYLLYLKSLPISKRKQLAKGKNIFLIDTDLSQAYKLLGIELKQLETNPYQTKILGPYGYYLYRESNINGFRTCPILNSKGQINYEIEYRKEKDVVIPEHYVGRKILIAANKDNVFDYYYNRQFKEQEKIDYLTRILSFINY